MTSWYQSSFFYQHTLKADNGKKKNSIYCTQVQALTRARCLTQLDLTGNPISHFAHFASQARERLPRLSIRYQRP